MKDRQLMKRLSGKSEAMRREWEERQQNKKELQEFAEAMKLSNRIYLKEGAKWNEKHC